MDIVSQIFKFQLTLLSLYFYFKMLRQGIQLSQTHSNTPSTFIVLGTYCSKVKDTLSGIIFVSRLKKK